MGFYKNCNLLFILKLKFIFNMQSLRLSAVPIAWSVLVNKFDPPKLNTIEISNYYEGWCSELPPETVKLAQVNSFIKSKNFKQF